MQCCTVTCCTVQVRCGVLYRTDVRCCAVPYISTLYHSGMLLNDDVCYSTKYICYAMLFCICEVNIFQIKLLIFNYLQSIPLKRRSFNLIQFNYRSLRFHFHPVFWAHIYSGKKPLLFLFLYRILYRCPV